MRSIKRALVVSLALLSPMVIASTAGATAIVTLYGPGFTPFNGKIGDIQIATITDALTVSSSSSGNATVNYTWPFGGYLGQELFTSLVANPGGEADFSFSYSARFVATNLGLGTSTGSEQFFTRFAAMDPLRQTIVTQVDDVGVESARMSANIVFAPHGTDTLVCSSPGGAGGGSSVVPVPAPAAACTRFSPDDNSFLLFVPQLQSGQRLELARVFITVSASVRSIPEPGSLLALATSLIALVGATRQTRLSTKSASRT